MRTHLDDELQIPHISALRCNELKDSLAMCAGIKLEHPKNKRKPTHLLSPPLTIRQPFQRRLIHQTRPRLQINHQYHPKYNSTLPLTDPNAAAPSSRTGVPIVPDVLDELALNIGAEIVGMILDSRSCTGVRERANNCDIRLPYDDDDGGVCGGTTTQCWLSRDGDAGGCES